MKNPINERTFVMIKADGIHRSLVGEIIQRLERTGLKIVGIKMLIPTRDQVISHYGKDDVWFEKVGNRIVENIKKTGDEPKKEAINYGKDVIEGLVKYFVCSPAVAIVIEGNQAVGIIKKIVGGTEPLTSDVGTIRGDLTIDSYELANLDDGRAVRNLLHCSDVVEEAEREIKVWFKEDELMDYKHINEKMLYDVNIDGILE